ncbi:MAG: protein-export chaperone SecB, partial [Caldibacillus thermoamylovorans]
IEDLQKFKLINGSAILFPYLRSVLTDLTSKSKHQPVILPTVNFSKYITSKKLADLLLDSDFYEES